MTPTSTRTPCVSELSICPSLPLYRCSLVYKRQRSRIILSVFCPLSPHHQTFLSTLFIPSSQRYFLPDQSSFVFGWWGGGILFMQLTKNVSATSPKQHYLKIIWQHQLPIPEKVQDISEEDSIPVYKDPPLGVMQKVVCPSRKQCAQ